MHSFVGADPVDKLDDRMVPGIPEPKLPPRII